MPPLNNPSDLYSNEYGNNFMLSELVRYWLREKVVPDGLVVAVAKSALPYESGIRIYRVDNEIGLTGEYDKDIRAATTSAFPGCQPIRISIPPYSRDIITFTGSASDRMVTHRYEVDRSLNIIGETHDATIIPYQTAFNYDGTVMYVTDYSNPNQVERFSRNRTTGEITSANGSGYPFGVGCAPISIRTSNVDNLVFAATTSYLPLGIYSFKNTGIDSGFVTAGSPYDPADNPTQHNNLCVSENDRLLYMTSGNTTMPIYGIRYDADGNMNVLPNSPFSPDTSYLAHGPTDNQSTSMTIDPNHKYLAILYSAGGSFNIRLLSIDPTTGTLTPTDQKLSVGNAPKHLDWDNSGKFLYLISDTGGTTNNFQLEYFKFTNDGKLSRGINSPITIGAMSGDFTPRHLKSISRYY